MKSINKYCRDLRSVYKLYADANDKVQPMVDLSWIEDVKGVEKVIVENALYSRRTKDNFFSSIFCIVSRIVDLRKSKIGL